MSEAELVVGNESFTEAFVRDMRDLHRSGPVSVELAVADAVAVLGMLHLALRHPGARGPSAVRAALVADDLVRRLGVTDVLRRGLEAGKDPRHDTATPAAEGRTVIRPQKVCLIGSSRFKADFERAGYREELCGRLVARMAFFAHADGIPVSREERALLGELDLRRIDDNDDVLVINVDDYLGEASLKELAYAREQGKRVRWWRLPSRWALPGEGE